MDENVRYRRKAESGCADEGADLEERETKMTGWRCHSHLHCSIEAGEIDDLEKRAAV